jgi:hypothetical protein
VCTLGISLGLRLFLGMGEARTPHPFLADNPESSETCSRPTRTLIGDLPVILHSGCGSAFHLNCRATTTGHLNNFASPSSREEFIQSTLPETLRLPQVQTPSSDRCSSWGCVLFWFGPREGSGSLPPCRCAPPHWN